MAKGPQLEARTIDSGADRKHDTSVCPRNPGKPARHASGVTNEDGKRSVARKGNPLQSGDTLAAGRWGITEEASGWL